MKDHSFLQHINLNTVSWHVTQWGWVFHCLYAMLFSQPVFKYSTVVTVQKKCNLSLNFPNSREMRKSCNSVQNTKGEEFYFNWSSVPLLPHCCSSSKVGTCSSCREPGSPLLSSSCFAGCCCTWLRFAALLKSVCLFNSCKWNAQRGQCPSTHLLVTSLSRPQRHFCLFQTEAK